MDDNITKKHSKSLVIPTGKTTERMALIIFSRDYPFIKSGCFEGMLNWIKIDGMVNDHSSSCNSKRFKKYC